ncbi:MAG: sugar phosphate nucleotidyltransferase [Pseudomonadota bacterium]
MKALILAAGLGTRLLPHTRYRPKSMFSLGDRTILEHTIQRMVETGCDGIIINTHHLHNQIEALIDMRQFPIPVVCRHEPEILDTGGAIANVRDFMGDSPFFVINSDIVTDLDLAALWRFHLSGTWLVTLALHYCQRFNCVEINSRGFITRFHPTDPLRSSGCPDLMAFTGIQVLSPGIFSHMHGTSKFSSIALYSRLADTGDHVKGYVCPAIYWQDIGTPETYRDAVLRHLAGTVGAGWKSHPEKISIEKLKGDGSDRSWFRLTHDQESLVAVDHGIRPPDTAEICEADAFVAIGSHLFRTGISVPRVLAHDLFAGIALVQDLGDCHLEEHIRTRVSRSERLNVYRALCNAVLDFSQRGAKNFDTSWAWQTKTYSMEMILDKECRYFVESFLGGYLNKPVPFDTLKPEFETIAACALENSLTGFMHRDMQSRNIMVSNNRFFFIDFQGGRLGPVQYDLASLFIDPYVNLDPAEIETLLEYVFLQANRMSRIDPHRFLAGYRCCALTRNFQILGAFSFLSRIKKKSWFETFIPIAVDRLKYTIAGMDNRRLPLLTQIINQL